MQNRWNDQDAARHTTDLALRVYSSRLLGQDSSLVLHGGGNTSVKITQTNLLGEEEDILYVKGSGWDLGTIEEAGFAPVRMAHLLKLAQLEQLTDPQMVNELKTSMVLASAPSPSVETILHAALPYRYVDHTHADAVVTITNSRNGLARIQEIYGEDMVIIPYVMPGFDLARLCAKHFAAEASEKTIGMILMNHGIFSFGESAKVSYSRMIELVARAEEYLKANSAWDLPAPTGSSSDRPLRGEISTLRQEISAAAGYPMLLSTDMTPACLSFARRADISTLSQQGPATPDHVIRTKRLPLLGRDIAGYTAAYRRYFEENNRLSKDEKTMLDPAPRMVLDPELGLCSLGRRARDAAIINDIYHHTLEIIQRAALLGGYQALPADDIFNVEYWDLEQAKLRKGGTLPPFSGEVALVTGAASGIGKACVDALLARGAAVVGVDINPEIETLFQRPDFFGLVCDLADETQITQALECAVRRFGGLDMLILNAGIFPSGCRIEALATEQWHRVLNVNLDANLILMRESHPLLKRAPAGGRVVIIGSKNVSAPGPGVAAYSASKAALNQLARVAALEWGPDGIRINSLHPDAVFDTALWSDELLQSRATHYNLTIEAYKHKNILQVEVYSSDVANLAAEMCGPLFAKTTAAQIPVDGGNDRVI
ncbi:MAG: bifunctional aldolase/short-chain dehydrogenase [Candidatus Polarisedimenticolaceae bacterium]|nr:bifunctional aldolase/short-chain dehydrogenase [Candidatus Polarisedimenticolaceae bacterium]